MVVVAEVVVAAEVDNTFLKILDLIAILFV